MIIQKKQGFYLPQESFVDITNKSGLNGLDNIQVLINGDYDMDGDDDFLNIQ